MNRSYEPLALFLTLFSCSDPVDGGGGGGDAGSGRAGSGFGRGGSAGAGGSGNPGGSGGATSAGSSGAGSSTGGSSLAGSSGAGTAGSTAGSTGSNGQCNSVRADAPQYFRVQSDDPAPAGKGGTVVDGTYVVTSSVWYEPPEIRPEELLDGIRMVIAGDTWEQAVDWPNDVAEGLADRYTTFVSYEGNTITTTQLCPVHLAPQTFEYTVEGDTVTVFVSDGVSILGMTLTRE